MRDQQSSCPSHTHCAPSTSGACVPSNTAADRGWRTHACGWRYTDRGWAAWRGDVIASITHLERRVQRTCAAAAPATSSQAIATMGDWGASPTCLRHARQWTRALTLGLASAGRCLGGRQRTRTRCRLWRLPSSSRRANGPTRTRRTWATSRYSGQRTVSRASRRPAQIPRLLPFLSTLDFLGRLGGRG